MAPAPWGPAPFTFKAQMLGGVTKVAVEVAGAAKGEGFMILVTGGTGFIGSAIVKQLLDDGIDVSVLGRDGNKIRAVFGDRVEAREAAVGNRDRLREAFKGADVVINAVQFPSSPIEIPRRGWTFEEVDFKGTCNQVDAAKENAVGRFVCISGVGAAPEADKHWFRFKGMAEQYLVSSGLEWTVIRNTWVYGPEDASLNRLLGFSRFLPFVPMFGDGKQEMQPVFIGDVGRIVAKAVAEPAAANQTFELGGPDVMPMNDVLNTALDVMRRRRFLLHQPILAGKVLGRLSGLLPKPPLSADAVDFIASPAVADNSNLARVFDPELTELRDGLSTYLGP